MLRSSRLVFVCSLIVSACTFSTARRIGVGVDESDGGQGGGAADAGTRPPGGSRPVVVVDAQSEAAPPMPTVDANCGNKPYQINAPPPNLLVLLDRSRSMLQDAAGNQNGGMSSKWNLMISSIKQVVAETEGTIKWGLKYFGDDGSCGVNDDVAVVPALMNAAAITTSLDGTLPESSTPTTSGVTASGRYLAGLNDMGAKFILLATDGQPTCGGAGSAMTADDAAAIAAVSSVATMGIKTYVIGVATTTAPMADATLSQMATMGGTARAATPNYYPVSSTTDLVGALREIRSSVVRTCTYPIGTPQGNADLAVTRVTVNGVDIPKDQPDGWKWDAGMTSITFSGATCALLTDPNTTMIDVQILFGCKVIVI